MPTPKKLLTCLTAVLAVAAVTAPGASAAVEVGSDCQATSGASGYTFVQLNKVSGGALPIAAPSAGVVTKWKVNSAVGTAVGQKLQILRPTGAPNQFQTVAESTPGVVSLGLNSFDTRIPIQAGDRPGAADGPGGATPAPLYCAGVAGDELGALTPPSTVGSTNTYPPAANLVAAISIVIEPDADGDGFGDETQDKCPRSAKLQTECPLISLSSFGIAARNSALILLASSSSAAVNVEATVTVPGKSKKGKKGKARTLKLSGGAQTVAPGQLAQFVINYSVPLKAALTALSSKKTLTLNVTASATDAAGVVSSTATTLKLRGQAKPKKKK